jgi:hypothetical protein
MKYLIVIEPADTHWDFYNEWLPINVWKMMFHMEMGPFPWRPDIAPH